MPLYTQMKMALLPFFLWLSIFGALNPPKWPRSNLFLTQTLNFSPESLGEERYRVMREKKTEPAFSGMYLYDFRPGVYHCSLCSNPLFRSEDQYDSHSGWPSFKAPISPKNVYYLSDPTACVKRYEVLCRGCDSHLGHVFHDGPPPNQLRYSINSIALVKKRVGLDF